MLPIESEFSLPPMTRIAVAAQYFMTSRQLADKIKQRNLDIPPSDLMPKHQKMIYDEFGYPRGVKREWYADV